MVMRITGHETNGVHGCYRIIDEDEFRQAQDEQQAFIMYQTAAKKACPAQNRDSGNVHTDIGGTVTGKLGLKHKLRTFT